MAEGPSTLRGALQGRPLLFHEEGGGKLWKWVFFSGLFHIMLISSLFVIPHGPSRRGLSYPVYSVELVDGGKLGGGGVGSAEVSAPAPKPKEEPKKLKAERPPRSRPVKTQPVKIQPAKKEKSNAVESLAQNPHKTAMSEVKAMELKQKEAKKEPPPQQGLPGQVREKLIESALDRIKERAQAEQATKKAGGMNSGTGEGQGAIAPGTGGQGGGVIKGVEFMVYRNRMINLIKERWIWVGKRNDLEVTVRFGITESGEIVGLRLVRASGDQSFDSSVFRAIKSASPLPPPPESYRKDFSYVELTFQPKDLGGVKG